VSGSSVDLHGGRHTSRQAQTVWHLIDMDADGTRCAKRTQVKIGFTESNAVLATLVSCAMWKPSSTDNILILKTEWFFLF
jgi:hypothetical protein